MIVFDAVSVSYGKETVFKDFSMDIAKGEKAVLAGPSGAGKSTLLHAIMGFVKPASGKISVNGHTVDAEHIREIRKQIAWLPQDISFNVKSNKQLAYLPFTYTANQQLIPAESEMNSTLQALLLPTGILKKNTNEISGGQKQRILLASMLLLKKPVLLLDEPTSALDAESVKALLALIFTHRELTVLSTSHDRLWIENMDRIINLKKIQHT